MWIKSIQQGYIQCNISVCSETVIKEVKFQKICGIFKSHTIHIKRIVPADLQGNDFSVELWKRR